MIVRDEANVIKRCLDSVKRHITHYAIVDTGSTDGTQDVIRRELAGLPGHVIDRPWENFAVGRQQALELAQASGATFLLTLDADEQLVWPEGKPIPDLTDDLYTIRFRLPQGDSTWSRALLLRAGLPWRWKGAVHETLECEGHEAVPCMIENAYVVSHTDGARGQRPKRRYSVLDYLPGKPTLPPAKYRHDIVELRRQIAAEPKNPRAWFYLAQSYACNLEFDEAIAAYRHRATLGGDPEEIFYALYQVAGLLGMSDRPWTEAAAAYQAAYQFRPTRAESLWALAVLHNSHEQPSIALLYARAACGIKRPRDVIMVDEAVYRFRAAEEVAASLTLLGQYAEALSILERVRVVKDLRDEDKERIASNIAYLTEKLEEASAA